MEQTIRMLDDLEGGVHRCRDLIRNLQKLAKDKRSEGRLKSGLEAITQQWNYVKELYGNVKSSPALPDEVKKTLRLLKDEYRDIRIWVCKVQPLLWIDDDWDNATDEILNPTTGFDLAGAVGGTAGASAEEAVGGKPDERQDIEDLYAQFQTDPKPSLIEPQPSQNPTPFFNLGYPPAQPMSQNPSAARGPSTQSVVQRPVVDQWAPSAEMRDGGQGEERFQKIQRSRQMAGVRFNDVFDFSTIARQRERDEERYRANKARLELIDSQRRANRRLSLSYQDEAPNSSRDDDDDWRHPDRRSETRDRNSGLDREDVLQQDATLNDILKMLAKAELKRETRSKTLTIEKFGGDATKYLGWRKQMMRFLVRRTDFEEEDQIMEVRKQLTGEALEKTNSALMREGCLASLMEILDNAYDNPKIAITEAYRQLMPFAVTTEPRSSAGLKSLEDRLTKYMINARVLKFTTEDLGVLAIAAQMDPKTRGKFVDWQGLNNSRAVATADQVIDFLRKEKAVVLTEHLRSK